MLISQSGGLLYHAKAFRYQSSIWRPFRDGIEQWLRTHWNPDRTRPLILIGPSAGWCLPLEFLREFSTVIAYDPDPLALWILKQRLKHPGFRGLAQDALGVTSAPPAEPLRKILESPSLRDASMLFCNLWGQLYFEEGAESSLPRWRREVETLLDGRVWASFFDRVSGPMQPTITAENQTSAGSLTDSELIERFYSNDRERGDQPIELQDHFTENYFKKNPRLHLIWQLRPGKYHLIEAISAVAG